MTKRPGILGGGGAEVVIGEDCCERPLRKSYLGAERERESHAES